MVEVFTQRENEIASELALGLSEKMIADKLYIDPETVRTHKKNMRKKIDGHCTVDIVRKFILSLENPKEYFSSLICGGLLIVNIAFSAAHEYRRAPRIERICRYSRIKNHKYDGLC